MESREDFEKGYQAVIKEGMERTRKEAERKAKEEKSLLRDLLEMSDHVDEISEALLTVDQVAVQLGVSSQTIRNWEKQDILKPACKTDGGHRRYHQSQITELRRSQKDFEIFLKIEPKNLLIAIQQVLSNFSEEETVSVSIRSDSINKQMHFTIDSEDGLCTFTKTLKMEE